MPRYRLTIEYFGREFVGWQRQANGPSVQAALEDAVFAFTGERAIVHGAGRTDAGVHALGQVAHVDLARDADACTVREALNFHLRPASVAVVAAARVAADFHARFSATRRVYRYRILNRRAPPVLDRDRVWWVAKRLDAARMHVAAQQLVGRHDFTTFRASLCQAKSPVKTLDRIAVARIDDEICIDVEARSFLHHQVRNITGTLVLVGGGKWSPADVTAALSAKDRRRCGPTAPACGLYLMAVGYPDAAAPPAVGDGAAVGESSG